MLASSLTTGMPTSGELWPVSEAVAQLMNDQPGEGLVEDRRSNSHDIFVAIHNCDNKIVTFPLALNKKSEMSSTEKVMKELKSITDTTQATENPHAD